MWAGAGQRWVTGRKVLLVLLSAQQSLSGPHTAGQGWGQRCERCWLCGSSLSPITLSGPGLTLHVSKAGSGQQKTPAMARLYLLPSPGCISLAPGSLEGSLPEGPGASS